MNYPIYSIRTNLQVYSAANRLAADLIVQRFVLREDDSFIQPRDSGPTKFDDSLFFYEAEQSVSVIYDLLALM